MNEATADEPVFNAIYEAVQSRRLQPGAKLREVEMATLFKVSRNSVRSAFMRLAHKGLLELAPNRGASVARPTLKQCQDILAARRVIEGAIVQTLAATATPQAVRMLRNHVKAQKSAFVARDVAQGHKLAMDFHRLMAKLAGNSLFESYVEDLLGRMPLILLTHASHRNAAEATHAGHIELVEAIAAHDVDQASRLLDEHLAEVEVELNLSAAAAPRTMAEIFGLE